MGVIAETAVKVRADTSGFHSEVHSGVMGSIAKIGAAAAGALGGLALGKALFVDPIKSAANFQQTLSVLQATSHATGAQMKDISAKAIQLGADVKLPATSAGDAATAMLELAKGGFTAKQSMEAAHGVLLLSAAAQIDNATAATYTADALHAFGMRARESGKVVDDFAGAANASTASMGEVAQALQQSGQGFHALGIPIGDATTAIAAMANAGIKGSDAGTSLKTMLQRLNPQTTQAKKEFHELGIHVFDQNGKFIGLRKTIEQFGPKLRGMSQEQRQHALSVIFGSDASRAAGIILGKTGAQWDKLHGSVTKAGQAQQLANAQSKGFNGAMSGLRSTIETLQIQIGLKMLPVLTTFVHFLSNSLPVAVKAVSAVLGAFADALRGVADWLGVFQGKIDTSNPGARSLAITMADTKTRFDEFKDAVAKVIGVIQQFASWVSDNVGNIKQIGIAVGVGAAAFVLLTGAVKAYTIVQAALNAVMSANPIGLVIIAIAALVVGMTLLYQRSETARNIMNAAFDAIKTAASAVFGFITNTVIPDAIAAWNRFGPGVVAALSTAASTIKTVVNGIATAVKTVIDAIKNHWDAIWSVFGPLAKGYLDIAKTSVKAVLDLIADAVRLFSDLLHGRWGAAWGDLKNMASDALNAVKTVVTTALTALETSAGNLAELVGKAIVKGVKSAVAGLAGLAGDLTGKISSALSQVAGWAVGAAAEIGTAIGRGVVNGISGMGGAIKSKIESVVGGVLKSVNFPGLSPPEHAGAHAIGIPIMRGIMGGVESLREKLAQSIEGSVGSALARGGEAVGKATPAMTAAFESWAKGVETKVMAAFATMHTKVDAEFAKAQAKLDAWKAKMTPTEALLASMQAQAQLAAIDGAVANAKTALAKLDTDFNTTWAKLLADQAANMAKLKATQGTTVTSKDIAGHEFDKTAAATHSDPLATNLLNAQKALDTTKALYAQGTATQDALFAAQDAYDAASAAAANDADAQKLLSDYGTWQDLITQAATGAQGITDQETTDAQARATALQTYSDARVTASQAVWDAIGAQQTAALGAQAAQEVTDRDNRYNELDTGLKKRHDRIDTHLTNVAGLWKKHFDAQVEAAKTRGKDMADAYVTAIGKLDDPNGDLAQTLDGVATLVKKYLKLNSPAEVGPLSDLDTWWTKLAPTLVSSLNGSSIKAALADAVMPDAGSFAGAGRLLGGAATSDPYARSQQRVENLLERIEKHTGVVAEKPNPVLGSSPVTVIATGGADAAVIAAKR